MSTELEARALKATVVLDPAVVRDAAAKAAIKNGMLALEARAMKCTLVLDPSVLAGLEVPNGTAKVTLRIKLPDRLLKAVVNAKSLRRCVAAIDAAGPDGVAVVLQGKLQGDELTEAGIAAQPKAPKVAAA
jgi:hypothetical protein